MNSVPRCPLAKRKAHSRTAHKPLEKEKKNANNEAYETWYYTQQ